MILTLWRHGQAGEASSDRLRELTGEGEDDIGFACHQLHEACEARKLPAPGTILYSPWLRTERTAEIIAAAFTRARQEAMAALAPGGDIPGVDAALAALGLAEDTAEHLVLVSHQPLVSRLVDHYLGEPGRVPALTPGGLASLSLPVAASGCAQLLFWATAPEYEVGI